LKSFLASKGNVRGVEWILMGVPLDLTVSRLPGSRKGPEAIRVESIHLETYSMDAERDLEDISFHDVGDIVLEGKDVRESLEVIEAVVNRFLAMGKKLFTFGGEHLVTLPLVKAASKLHPDIKVLHFDAHADLRENYHGSPLTHATVMRRVAETCLDSPKSLYQLGIRSATRDEFRWAKENTNFAPEKVLEPLKEILPLLRGHPVYVSIDIDVVDPGFAPGTGTPEPCGIKPQELLGALRLLGSLDIVGCDLVEISPMLDVNGITASLGARICRDSLLFWAGEA